MIDGKEITLGGRTFIAPPAPFACIRKFQDVFSGKVQATLPDMADIVYAALKRNYSELTQEEFDDKYLDMGNIKDAFQAVMLIAGAKEPTSGEADPGSQLIGTSSTVS
jgi:hypothetical protein